MARLMTKFKLTEIALSAGRRNSMPASSSPSASWRKSTSIRRRARPAFAARNRSTQRSAKPAELPGDKRVTKSQFMKAIDARAASLRKAGESHEMAFLAFRYRDRRRPRAFLENAKRPRPEREPVSSSSGGTSCASKADASLDAMAKRLMQCNPALTYQVDARHGERARDEIGRRLWTPPTVCPVRKSRWAFPSRASPLVGPVFRCRGLDLRQKPANRASLRRILGKSLLSFLAKTNSQINHWALR